ncbi:Uma2 family endonuclease [Methylomagnum sp.]
MSVAHQRFFTADDYLAWEADQATKHEYVRGEVFAMAGVKDAHVTVALNVASWLKTHLRGTPCRTYIADMKLQVEAADAFFYPDVFVTCDPRDQGTDLFKRYPSLIAEVLSESTARYDHGRKFATYRLLDSLQEYVLIDPDAQTVDVFRRDATGHWVLYPYAGEVEAEFISLECRAPLAAIFEDVALPAPPGTELAN